jgi:hypothetical protein
MSLEARTAPWLILLLAAVPVAIAIAAVIFGGVR